MTHSDAPRILDDSHACPGSGQARPHLLKVRFIAGLVALTTFATMVAAASAGATISDNEELFQVGGAGSAAAGQFSVPNSVASDPTTGHIFVTEEANNRVSEFTPWGEFVKAFGWDVAPGAVNEQQEVRVRATGGQFQLGFGGETTGNLPFDAKATEMESALKDLPAIGSEGVSVRGIPGTSDGKTPYIDVVAFKGPLAATDVAQLTTTNGSTPLSGDAEIRTRADGHGATTGLESCTTESGCRAGQPGFGAGQFFGAGGVAVDASGSVYVREVDNRRVQEFDPAGRFILMFGGEVDKTTGADICTKASGDECGAGVIGAGSGEFGAGFARGIALNSAGALFVGDVERIQRFNSEGEWQDSVACPGKTIYSLAIAATSGDFYAQVGTPASGGEQDIRKLDGTSCAENGRLNGSGAAQGAVATDTAGNVFIKDGRNVLEFGPDGNPLSPASCCGGEVEVQGLGTNAIGDLYVASSDSTTGINLVRAFGPAPVDFEGPPPVAPQVTAQFAISVGHGSATVAADINPNFFPDTTYFVQYGIGKCSEGGCAETPVPPADLTKKAVKAPVGTAGVPLAGLEPGTIYHYRFVAQSSGGGPIFGPEAEFTTFPTGVAPRACANDTYRFGAAAQLPDCRAYEMVSPVDKNNGDIKTLLNITSFTTNLSQSALDGSRFTYSSQRGFADPKAASYTNQYLASRDPISGWSSEALEPAQTSEFGGNSFENHNKLFSADLCQSWLVVAAEPELAPGATSGHAELYSRNGGGTCGAVGYQALIQSDKTSLPLLQGASADGREAIFGTQAKLTEDAAGGGLRQIYYTSNGQLRLLCVLPSGLPNKSNCSAGTGGNLDSSTPPLMERLASLTNALSADGSKAYWTDLPPVAGASGPGKIYLRLKPGAEQSTSGCEEEKACTVAVSGTVNQQNARFLRASTDGTKALFEITDGGLAGNLYMFEAEANSSTLIAGKSLGVAGASDDLARVYFVSENVLAGTTGGTAGDPNLYYRDGEGVETFVATLAPGDVQDGDRASNTNSRPIYHAARATPDGRVLTFISSESLTGYDNTDQLNGTADSEVYLYEVGAGGPVCVSCNPSAARPSGRILAPPHFSVPLPAAAWLPFPENSLYTPRVISNDGRRLFFTSFDALLPRDTNGKADVYEWESASGQAACDERGAELYVPGSGGCLSLISNGQNSQDSELLDTSANGNDAFFTTSASLLPRDPGQVDVYDARVGGGIAEPPPPPPVCQGETCQPVVSAPVDPTPSSSSYVGPGNEKPAKAKKNAKHKKHKKKNAKHKHKKKQQKNSKKHRTDRGQGGRR